MKSLTGKIWEIKNEATEGSLINRVLSKRDLGNLNADLNDLNSPYKLKDIRKAVERIMKAIQDGERIMIFGDYDVDGVTSSAILLETLNKLGAKASVRLPNRFTNGYGLNEDFIEECKKLEVGLIITVDCGVSDIQEIELAKQYGIEVIITDHHHAPPTLPRAYAIVNPKQNDCTYPFEMLAGAGVVFKLIQVLFEYAKLPVNEAYKYLDLVALATTADCMPILGENRILVKCGLEKLATNPSVGLKELMKQVEVDMNKLSTYTFGFQIGPPLNAAGRLDNALDAFHLLSGRVELASKLVEMNKERQELLKKALEEAEETIKANVSEMVRQAHHYRKRVIVVKSVDWGVGIIGLIASKLTEKYHRPSLVMTERNGELVGSARSIEAYSIIDALTRNKDLFTHFGGHAQAAGFSLSPKNFDKLAEEIERDANEYLSENDLIQKIRIDTVISGNEVNFENIEELEKLKPFGIGNATPLLLAKGVSVTNVRSVGSVGNHLSFLADLGGEKIRAIAFGFGEYLDILNKGDQFDLVVQMEVNEWRDKRSLQLVVKDVAVV